MGSPAGCECHFRQLHLNMIERSLLPENTTEMPVWRSVANSTSGHNAFGHFSDEHQTRWGNSAMICPTTKKLNRRCCASVASVWRSIPVQRRMEKDL